MDKKSFFIGIAVGFIAPVLSVVAFSILLGDGSLSIGYSRLEARDQLSNAIRIGVLIDLAIFTIAISKGRERLSQGIVVSTLLSLIYSLI